MTCTRCYYYKNPKINYSASDSKLISMEVYRIISLNSQHKNSLILRTFQKEANLKTEK